MAAIVLLLSYFGLLSRSGEPLRRYVASEFALRKESLAPADMLDDALMRDVKSACRICRVVFSRLSALRSVRSMNDCVAPSKSDEVKFLFLSCCIWYEAEI